MDGGLTGRVATADHDDRLAPHGGRLGHGRAVEDAAPDEAGHAGDVEEKVKALENWDRRILAGLVEGLDALGPWRMLLLPDHATPLRTRTHTSEPVPYLLVDSRVDGPGGTYTEAGVADAELVPGHELMGRLVAVR